MVAPGKIGGVAMTEQDIAATIRAFAQAAADAKTLGFDAVEIHGAHGYLIDQFFWHPTNQRTDGYGGDSLVKRSRFARELISAVRQAVGPDFAIMSSRFAMETPGLYGATGDDPASDGAMADAVGGSRR